MLTVIQTYLIYGLVFVNLQLVMQLLSQFFYAKNAYWNAELKSFILSIIIIGFVIFDWQFLAVDPLIMGHVVGVIIVTLVMFIQLIRKKLLFLNQLNNWNRTKLKLWGQWLLHHLIPIFFVFSLSIVSLFCIQYVMSSFGPSILSANDYALRLYGLLILLIFIPIITPFYTLISSENSTLTLSFKRFNRIAIYCATLFLCVISIIFFFSEFGIKLLFERGEFSAYSTLLTSQLLIFYSLGLLFDVLRKMLLRIFLVYQKTQFIVLSAIVSNSLFCIGIIYGQHVIDSFLIVPISMAIIGVIFTPIEYIYFLKESKKSPSLTNIEIESITETD